MAKKKGGTSSETTGADTATKSGAASLLIDRSTAGNPTTIEIVRKDKLEYALSRLTPAQRNWLTVSEFTAEPGRIGLVPDDDGKLAVVLFGANDKIADGGGPLQLGIAPGSVPPGDYALAHGADAGDPALAWALGSYRFERYRGTKAKPGPRLVVMDGKARSRAIAIADSVWLARDLINTPAADMGPEELEGAARGVASEHGATLRAIVGDDLLSQNFPMIHAVGRASTRAPRLVDFSWGRPEAIKVTLVGKGICFDTGGLDIKTADGMAAMKKDMGGAATVLALARMIMTADLDVRLRVLLPIAENSISGNAFRPGDVLTARNGKTVEIGNTDAEGRLVLADAMALACEERPDILATYATLTGAARVALGPELPAMFTDDDALAADVQKAGLDVDDPVWRMPLWMPYDKLLRSSIADMNHISGGPMAGSVTAALFLKRFAEGAHRFLHFDIYASNPKPKPGKPEGAEPQGARALFEVLERQNRKSP